MSEMASHSASLKLLHISLFDISGRQGSNPAILLHHLALANSDVPPGGRSGQRAATLPEARCLKEAAAYTRHMQQHLQGTHVDPRAYA